MKIGKSKSNCIICLNEYKKKEKIYKIIKCGHKFH